MGQPTLPTQPSIHGASELSRSPFVQAQMAGQEVSMLLDTGADISLISRAHLSDRQKQCIQQSSQSNPRAASGNEVKMEGVLRMTFRLGKVIVTNHPFHVVTDLVVPMIGGAYFLSLLGKQT